jgi:hypothetical protein
VTEFGEEPVPIGRFELHLEWQELMHYLYLPVVLPEHRQTIRLPQRLAFAYPAVFSAMLDADVDDGHYVYLTARRGFASPDNPLNRPGWHCDGFGTDDLNYTWSDRWGSRWAEQPFEDISDDHLVSMEQFEEQVDRRLISIMGPGYLWRLTPRVVHTTPEIPPPGGMRSFLKISISRHRYNLIGNSRNHLFDYDWKMYPRDAARNDPASYMADFYEP